jgi:hypothetical protein
MHTDYKLYRYRPSPDALLNPCSDEVFKALFTNESEESRTVLRSFLTAVLHKEVTDVQLRPNEPSVLDDSDKAVKFDVSCTFNNGEAADIELQGVNKYSSLEKWCKFLVDADNPDKQEYINRLTAAEGGIMEAKKTPDKISSDWVLWKRELDREVIERDRISELHYAQEQGDSSGKAG